MNQEKAARKCLVNASVAMIAIVIASVSALIPDPTLAFLVSTISIHVAGFAAMFAPAWILWGAYHAGDLDGDYQPLSARDVFRAGKQWAASRYANLEHEVRRRRAEQ